MKMTGTWIKRGSTIELLDGDPPTRATREFAGEEEFLSEVPTPLTRCGGDMDDVDVKLRIFIPSPAVKVPIPGAYDIAGGDNRGYSYK